MAQDIDWDSGVITPPPGQADATDWDSGVIAPPPKRGFGSDARNALMQGVQQLPGAATGLADIGAGAVGLDRPFSRAADKLGAVTGFQPSQWAKDRDALYSDETKAANAEIDRVWEDPNTNALDIGAAYARNPRTSALQVLRSVPGMLAAATLARGAGVVLPAASAVARAALGEGAVMGGQAMDQIDTGVDPQRAAAAAATTGVVGGAIGAAGGKIAARLGVRDIDTTLAGGAAGQAAQQAPGLARRVATGVVQEGLIEEGSQSAVETAAQNWAEGKPLTEGMARNVTEGAIAGGIMGGGISALPHRGAAPEMGEQSPTDQGLDDVPDQFAGSAVPPPVPATPGWVSALRDQQDELPPDRAAYFEQELPALARVAEDFFHSGAWQDLRGELYRRGTPPEVQFAVARDFGTLTSDDPATQPQQRHDALSRLWDRLDDEFSDFQIDQAELAAQQQSAPPAQRPSETMGIDPAAGPISRAAAESVDSQPDRLTPEEVRAFNNAYRREVPDPLGDLQEQVRADTAYTSADQVADVRGEIEDAWLQSNVPEDAEVAGAVETAAPPGTEPFGDPVAEADARLRDRRILSALQNAIDGEAGNALQTFGYVNTALRRIGETSLSEQERGRVRRVLDAQAAFTGRTQAAPLPEARAASAPLGDVHAQNAAMEARIPERAPAALRSETAGQDAPAGRAAPAQAAFATYEDAETFLAQRRADGERVTALPLSREDGSVALAARGSQEYAAAEGEQRQRSQRAAGVLEGDVLSRSGEIFGPKQQGLARMHASRMGPGYAVAPVTGGFVVRRSAEPNPAPDAVPAQAVQATEGQPARGRVAEQDGRANTDAAQLTAPAAAPVGPVGPAAVMPPQAGPQALQAPRAADGIAAQPTSPQNFAGPRIDQEWTAFAPESGSKGVPRAQMPQIRAAHRGAMVQFLKGRGIGHAQETVAPGTLKPTQAEFSPRKVARAAGFKGGDRSILVSADGHVLDGHHQWMAKLQAGQPVDVIRLDAPIERLIDEVRQFPSAATAVGATSAQDDGAGAGDGAAPAPQIGSASASGQQAAPAQTSVAADSPAPGAGQSAGPAPASDPAPSQQQPAPTSTPAQRAAPAPAAARAAASPAIQDFGEKLHGARKDYAAQLRDAQDVDVAAEPLSKSWPEPDYQKLLAAGTDPKVVALIRAARDEVPTKPQKSWRLAGWVEQTKALRQVADDVLAGRAEADEATLLRPGMREQLARLDAAAALMAIRGRAELYEVVGHARSLKGVTFGDHHYSLYRGEANVRKWVVEQKAKATMFSNWPRELAVGNTREEALEQFRAKLGALDLGTKAKGQTQFDIYRRRGTTDYIIGKKIGREQIDLKRFPDVVAARAFLRDSPAELESLLARYKETPLERRPENQPRVGDDHRSGAPVTPQAFAETFGFRGVQFGNYVEQGRRQSDLNEAFDALMDLAAVLGIPPRSLSLNGRLGLAFGARGRGGKGAPGAHYEPDTVVINLTKGGGPGALAHEWWHSLDNYFGREGGSGGFVTDGARADALRAEMQAAFQQVRQATQVKSLRERARELDRRRSKPYWNTPLELSARAFESYVIAKLQDQNASNDYLANIVGPEAWDVMDAARARVLEQQQAPTYPYPTTAEMPAVREAFDGFFRTVETRETDTGVALFSRSAMKSVEANVQRGRAAMNRVLLERADVRRAMHRSDLGWIDFVWGDDKKGVQHILRQRQAKDGMTALQVMRMLRDDIVETIARGETTRRVEVKNVTRVTVVHQDAEAQLVRRDGANGWLLTGYERKPSGAARAGFDATGATQGTPTLARRAQGADGPKTAVPDATGPGLILPPTLPHAQIQSAANAIARRWTNGPEVVVAANMQDPVLPARIRDTDAGQRARGADGAPQGVYLGGKVYLIADQLRSERDVATTLFHEVLGHHGLRGAFGDTLQPILSQLATMRRADVEAKAAAYGLDLSKPEQRLLAAEEVLAEMAQDRPQLGWVQRAVAAVRSWLRANVPGLGGLRLTDAEIVRSFLVPARGFVERGGRGGRGAAAAPAERTDPVFSRGAATGQVVTDLKRRAGNTLADYRHLALSALGRRQIVDLYGQDLPQLQAYSDMVQQMDADKNEAGAGADQIATAWGKLKDERQLADLMHDATLEQIDPAKPFVPGDNQTTYLALKQRYDALTPEARKVYTDARDTYRRHHEAVRTAIRERIERSALRGPRKAELLQQMDSDFFKAIKGVYFPLARFGQYVVVVRGADGKAVNVSRAETLNEAEAMRHTLRRAYPGATVGKVLKAKEFNAGRDAVGRGFMEELYKALGTRDMDDKQRGELEDMLGQLYLSALPDLSWAKHGIHRKGTPGFSQDARRAFAQNVFHGARYLAKVRYSDLLDTELAEMQKHVDGKAGDNGYDSVQAQQVLDEMVKRHDAMMNPDTSALSTALTSLGFVFHLGLSPASAAVNLTQTAFVALPIMGAKWGFTKSSAALLKASRQAAANRNDISSTLTAQERQAYDEAVRSGVIDVTMAHDLAGISQGEDAKVSWKLRPVMRWASFLFHHAEKFNRQVTFVAAYRLAREAGSGHQQAYAEAVKATYDGHFDYGSSNRARIMQGNVARVVLLFKQYAQNMIYTLSRQAFLAVKAEQPAARAEARKALGGLLAMHAAGAGILGLPLVTTLLAAASAVGGSDDEPWDAEVALRNMLADAFGQKPAEVLARGLSRLTPSDISGRVGLDKLILPDIQEGLEGQRLGESAMAAALGPVAGIGISMLRGLQEMADGNWARGLEAMAPSAVRGPIKALRYAEEGVVDRNGKAVLAEVDGLGILGQAMGFSPSDVRLAYEGKSAIYQADQRLVRRRADLMRQFSMAKVMGDEEAAQEAQGDIQAFNNTNPDRRITAMNLAASIRMRRRQIEEAEQGIYLPRARRDAIGEGRFAAEAD